MRGLIEIVYVRLPNEDGHPRIFPAVVMGRTENRVEVRADGKSVTVDDVDIFSTRKAARMAWPRVRFAD